MHESNNYNLLFIIEKNIWLIEYVSTFPELNYYLEVCKSIHFFLDKSFLKTRLNEYTTNQIVIKNGNDFELTCNKIFEGNNSLDRWCELYACEMKSFACYVIKFLNFSSFQK